MNGCVVNLDDILLVFHYFPSALFLERLRNKSWIE